MTRDPHCIFCKILAGEIPSARVLDTDHLVAFLDVNPVAVGHLLVVPKDHAETLSEAAPESVAALGAELPRLVRAVLAATSAPGLNVLQNNGPAAGQVVPHVHFHLIPRSPGDAVRVHWPARKADPRELDDLRTRIAHAL